MQHAIQPSQFLARRTPHAASTAMPRFAMNRPQMHQRKVKARCHNMSLRMPFRGAGIGLSGQIRLAVICIFIASNLSKVSAQEITAEQLLDFIEKGLRTCEDVSKVTRDDTIFTVHEYTTKYEFDLTDLNSDHTTGYNPYIILRCDSPACISRFFNPTGAKWYDAPPLNFKPWKCNEMARDLRRGVRGYRLHF